MHDWQMAQQAETKRLNVAFDTAVLSWAKKSGLHRYPLGDEWHYFIPPHLRDRFQWQNPQEQRAIPVSFEAHAPTVASVGYSGNVASPWQTLVNGLRCILSTHP